MWKAGEGCRKSGAGAWKHYNAVVDGVQNGYDKTHAVLTEVLGVPNEERDEAALYSASLYRLALCPEPGTSVELNGPQALDKEKKKIAVTGDVRVVVETACSMIMGGHWRLGDGKICSPGFTACTNEIPGRGMRDNFHAFAEQRGWQQTDDRVTQEEGRRLFDGAVVGCCSKKGTRCNECVYCQVYHWHRPHTAASYTTRLLLTDFNQM